MVFKAGSDADCPAESANIADDGGGPSGPSASFAIRVVALGGGANWSMRLLNGICTPKVATTLAVAGVPSLLFNPLSKLLLMCIALGCAKRLSGPTLQKALAWGVAAGFAANLAFSLAPLPASTASQTVEALCAALGDTCLILLWGLCFTTLDKHEAERTALHALAVACTIYLVVLLLPIDDEIVGYLSDLLVIATVIPILVGRYEIATVRRAGPANKDVLAPFYATRLFLGVCCGAITYLCTIGAAAQSERSYLVIAAMLVALLAFMVRQRKAAAPNLTVLRLAPAIACGIIGCPLMGVCDADAIVLVCAANCAWVSWSILHSVQLSAIKDKTGVDDCTLAITEKIAFVLAFAVTAVTLSLTPGLADFVAANPYGQVAAVVIFAFSAVMVCCYQLSRVIDGKETERIVSDTNALHEQRLEPVFEKMAADFGLTARELEVLRLLAKNRSRSAVCEELCISEGTYRTHIYRIYKKLDVHSHDELLELVERCARDYVAR